MHYSFQIFAWIACLLFSAETILVKVISSHQVKNPWLLVFVWTFIVFVINSGFCLFMGAGLPMVWSSIIWAGIFFAICSAFYIFANNFLDVSILSPLFNFKVVFAVLLGVIFLKETINLFQLSLIGIIILGGILVTMDEKNCIYSPFPKTLEKT